VCDVARRAGLGGGRIRIERRYRAVHHIVKIKFRSGMGRVDVPYHMLLARNIFESISLRRVADSGRGAKGWRSRGRGDGTCPPDKF
jgi:hypothetical protein